MAGDNTGVPTLDPMSQNSVLKPACRSFSSGDGGLLPPGLAIGTIVADRTGGFRVALLADSAASEDVRIVDFKAKAEQPPPVSPNDLPRHRRRPAACRAAAAPGDRGAGARHRAAGHRTQACCRPAQPADDPVGNE